jgi:NAD(P)H-dependent FMN reductase
MRLMLCNGSSRGKRSNTAILLKHFTDGFMATQGNSYEVAYLAHLKEHPDFAGKLRQADAAIIAFPLYTDSMPALVKDFIETLGAGKGDVPALGFIIQSGYPETIHSRFVEKYCEKLARRLNARYLGTIIRDGIEGIQTKPPLLTRRIFMAFQSLGRHFGVTKEFHPIIKRKLAGRERMSAFGRILFRILKISGISNLHWNKVLKKNGVFERRFDRPYQ